MSNQAELQRPFLDEAGLVKQLPAKGAKKLAVLAYLSAKFEPARDYREQEVNAILAAWHSFGDFYLLRRELVDAGFLGRERDCSRYWHIK